MRLMGVLALIAVCLLATPSLAENVGFDLDDTLVYSTPAFAQGFAVSSFGTTEFWQEVNTSDEGNSTVKTSVKAILDSHIADGDTVYVITARKDVNGDCVRDWVSRTFGIPASNVFFSSRKATLLRRLDIVVFYGDSDSDIEAALDAGILGVRIERSVHSSYQKNYSPGKYNEPVLDWTAE